MESSETGDVTTPLIPQLVARGPLKVHGACVERHDNRLCIKAIIVVVMLERLAYYSILANLFLFFKDDVYQDNGSALKSSKSVLILSSMSWLMCVGGGWISDSKLGKRMTLTIGFVFYIIGTCLLFVSAYFLHEIASYHIRALLVYLSIIIGLVGEGAYKANISPFGAEQLSNNDADSTRRFFNYYYASMNVGALLAYSIVAYLQQNGLSHVKGFVIGYAIPFASIFLAFVVFVSARKHYKSVPSQRILGKVYHIIKEAKNNRKRKIRSESSSVPPNVPWISYANLKYGGSYLDWEVEEVRLLLRAIPVFLVLIPYWSIYSQMQATFIDQGLHMNLYATELNFSLPAAWLNLLDIIVVVILIPIMEKGVYPWIAKHGYSPSPLTRITFGILIACLSIVAAGFVEIFVVNKLKTNETVIQTVNGQNVTAARLSVFWQIPQYVLVGISEVFAVVAGLEFAYRSAPKSMQSLVMALYFVTHSLGSLLGSGLLELSEVCDIVVKTPKHEYYSHTYYFFLLCVLMLLSWFVFVVFIKRSGFTEENYRQPRLRSGIRSHAEPSLNNFTE